MKKELKQLDQQISDLENDMNTVTEKGFDPLTVKVLKNAYSSLHSILMRKRSLLASKIGTKGKK